MLDVMLYEVFKEEEQAIKRYLPGDINAVFTPNTIQAHADKKVPAALVSIRTQSQIPQAWAKDDKFKAIISRSAGYDHLVEYQQLTQSAVLCGYLPSYCSRAVAEHAILLTMALMRRLDTQKKHFEKFDRDNITGSECQGKNLLVIGVGRIGSRIVDIARGLRMEVKGVDINPKVPELEYTPLHQGIKWANVITCALPLTKKTRNMLNYDTLRQSQPGSIFINISRGEISPLADLKRLLDEKTLGALGMDVFENEGRLAELLRSNQTYSKDPDLHQLMKTAIELSHQDNCLFTPHNAFNTEEALERKAEQSAGAIIHYLKEKTFPHTVPEE